MKKDNRGWELCLNLSARKNHDYFYFCLLSFSDFGFCSCILHEGPTNFTQCGFSLTDADDCCRVIDLTVL